MTDPFRIQYRGSQNGVKYNKNHTTHDNNRGISNNVVYMVCWQSIRQHTGCNI
jgi:hypothetical protein